MWIKRKRCKFVEDQIDSLMWHLIYKTVWFEPKFNRKFRFGTLTLAGPGSSSGEFVARRQTSLHLLRMFRKKPKDVCFLGVLRGLPDLLQYYIRGGGACRDPKIVLHNIRTAPNRESGLTNNGATIPHPVLEILLLWNNEPFTGQPCLTVNWHLWLEGGQEGRLEWIHRFGGFHPGDLLTSLGVGGGGGGEGLDSDNFKS